MTVTSRLDPNGVENYYVARCRNPARRDVKEKCATVFIVALSGPWADTPLPCGSAECRCQTTQRHAELAQMAQHDGVQAHQ
jgi:hypothetical protein